MSQFDFEDVKFVRGSETSVPDLFSRTMGTTGSATGAGGEVSGQTDSPLGHLQESCLGTVTDQEDGWFSETAGGDLSQHSLYTVDQMWLKARSACAHDGRR